MDSAAGTAAAATRRRVLAAVSRERLVATARSLIDVPSPSGQAGAVADRLAELLAADGFTVTRPVADWPPAPAVVTRLDSGAPGRVLQFDGHLDTVHLPFTPSGLHDSGGQSVLTGSGAADMKGGLAAAVEALRALREAGAPAGGAVLLTAHEHHEGPVGDGRQVAALARAGIHGDAVLLPEYLAAPLPLSGRGAAIFTITLRRSGEPIHEALRTGELPDVVAAGAELVLELTALGRRLSSAHGLPRGESDSLFVGRCAAGEIYNQVATECRIEGICRWMKPGRGAAAREQVLALAEAVAKRHHLTAGLQMATRTEAYTVAASDPVVSAVQEACRAVSGSALPTGPKPFVDDGNRYAFHAGIPALTHGPAASGAHTTGEQVPVAELLRVARVYALTALAYCATP
jgi:acetylornithine deacetylase/succinyl-diaminopimelate desuccinylase-like protein